MRATTASDQFAAIREDMRKLFAEEPKSVSTLTSQAQILHQYPCLVSCIPQRNIEMLAAFALIGLMAITEEHEPCSGI